MPVSFTGNLMKTKRAISLSEDQQRMSIAFSFSLNKSIVNTTIVKHRVSCSKFKCLLSSWGRDAAHHGYDYCTSPFIGVRTIALRRLKFCSQRFRGLRWRDPLAMTLAAKKTWCTFISQPFHQTTTYILFITTHYNHQ